MITTRSVTRAIRGRLTRIGACVLALLALTGLCADLVASDLPIFLRQPDHTYFLPAWTAPDAFGGRSAEEIESQLSPGDVALWPLVRAGPRTQTGQRPFAQPSWAHPLGVDAFGRDVLAGWVHATRTSLGMALVVSSIAVLVGGSLGGAAAALGGMWDALAERVVEVVSVFPTVVVVALVHALERRASLFSLMLVVLAVKVAELTRLCRVLVLRCLAEDWALAARASGASVWRMLRVEVLPHVMGPLAVAGALAASSVVLTESAVAFLELGASPNAASWGDMLAQIRWGAGARVIAPPVLGLALTVGALQLIAEGLRRSLRE